MKWTSLNMIFEGESRLARLILSLVRHWPFSRGRSGLLRILTRWCFQGLLPIRHPNGAVLRVDVTDYIGQMLAQTGVFEPASLWLACQLMRQGGWFVDAGCNFGLYTCVVGSQPGVKVLAIDPSPRALVQLENNLKLNPQVQCARGYVALSDTEKLLTFHIPSPLNLGTGQVQALEDAKTDNAALVAALPASKLLHAAGCHSIRLLKVDIEKGEWEALQGWDWSDTLRPENILCEHLPDAEGDERSARLMAFLKSKNYRPFTIEGIAWSQGMPLSENNLWWRSEPAKTA